MTHRVSALIRLHGIWLWLRRLPVVPRIPHAEKGRPLSTITHPAESPPRVPAPSPLRHVAAKRSWRRSFAGVPVRILLPGGDPLSVTDPRVHPDAPAIEIVRPSEPPPPTRPPSQDRYR